MDSTIAMASLTPGTCYYGVSCKAIRGHQSEPTPDRQSYRPSWIFGKCLIGRMKTAKYPEIFFPRNGEKVNNKRPNSLWLLTVYYGMTHKASFSEAKGLAKCGRKQPRSL